MTPSVTLLIPVWKPQARLEATLAAAVRQIGAHAAQIILPVTGPMTAQVRAARARFGATLVPVAPADFNHGETRNLGMRMARGEFVILMTQDAVVADEQWLRELLAPLRADPAVAGSTARQLAHEERDPVTRLLHAAGAAAGTRSVTWGAPAGGDWASLDHRARRRRLAFDHVCAAVRRSVWQRHPYRRLSFGEDMDWARRVLDDGFRLCFAAAARVRHCHPWHPVREWRRAFLGGKLLAELFPGPAFDDPHAFVDAAYAELRRAAATDGQELRRTDRLRLCHRLILRAWGESRGRLRASGSRLQASGSEARRSGPKPEVRSLKPEA